jgi:hypothetical protein
VTRERWAYIKALRVVPQLAWDSANRGTRNVGRNKAKRERRALAKRWTA